MTCQVLFQVGLTVLALATPDVLLATDDCSAMGILSQFLNGVCNTDAMSGLKAEKVFNGFVMLHFDIYLLIVHVADICIYIYYMYIYICYPRLRMKH
jgi:hypothetical protein